MPYTVSHRWAGRTTVTVATVIWSSSSLKLTWQAPDPSKHAVVLLVFKEVKEHTCELFWYKKVFCQRRGRGRWKNANRFKGCYLKMLTRLILWIPISLASAFSNLHLSVMYKARVLQNKHHPPSFISSFYNSRTPGGRTRWLSAQHPAGFFTDTRCTISR